MLDISEDCGNGDYDKNYVHCEHLVLQLHNYEYEFIPMDYFLNLEAEAWKSELRNSTWIYLEWLSASGKNHTDLNTTDMSKSTSNNPKPQPKPESPKMDVFGALGKVFQPVTEHELIKIMNNGH